MSLQRKFALLLTLLGATVAASLAAALWSFALLQREVAAPFSDIARSLDGLGAVKRSLEAQRRLVSPEPGAMVPEESHQLLAARVMEELERLEASENYARSTGVSTARNLHGRVQAAVDATAEAIANPLGLESPGAILAATDRIDEAVLVIERVERRVFSDAALAIAYSDALRGRLETVLVLSLASALLVCSLAYLLLRRWVTRPVGALRTAASRIAAGDFDHRLPVSGGDEIALLSAEVNHMAGMVSAMQEERVERERLAAIGEMVRRLAHNLRNPLAGIRGLAELTRTELPPGHDLREVQDRIVTTVDRFEQWLSDLLHTTSPLAIRVERREVGPWLLGVVDLHGPLAQSVAVSMEVDFDKAPSEAEFDPRHLEQALVAVVTNAIEASPRGGTVRISVQTLEDGEGWEIRVEDQGPGVPTELTERIFGAHFTTKPEGAGIGLAVAQQVVRGHGGRIAVERGLPSLATGGLGRGANETDECGAAFVIRLPGPLLPSEAPSDQQPRGQEGIAVGQDSDRRG